MALDPVVNFFQSEIATLPVASGGTSIVISSGDGAKLPDPAVDGAYNLTIYEEGNPFSLPEIVRVTTRSSDTLTVTRAQEGTTATTKTAGTTWKVVMFPTAKTIQDIDTAKLDVADVVDNLTSTSTTAPLSANQGKVLQDGKLNLSGGTMTGDLTVSKNQNATTSISVDNTDTTNTNSRSRLDVLGGTVESTLVSIAGLGGFVGTNTNHDLSIITNGNNRISIKDTGNVGIGTTSPVYRLDVNDNKAGGAGIRIANAGAGNPQVSFDNPIGTQKAAITYIKDNEIRFFVGGSDVLSLVSTSARPSSDNNKSLGTASFRWSEVFAGNGTINTSDATEKQDVAELNEAEQQVATALKGLIRKYRWISSVEQKGDDARIHVGVMAQDVAQAFEDAGLDAHRYGVFCEDTWYTKEETYTEQVENPDFDEEAEEGEDNLRMIDGEEQTRTVPCESDDLDATEHVRYGVRYDQLWAFIISAL